MRVTEVALTDIKSYHSRTVIPIEGGVTAILGENGAGKSTIQEAIGFALFDSLPFANKDFVREGASSGTVEVTFEQETNDGRQRYRVTRSAGRANYSVHRYDSRSNGWVDQDIDSKSALARWLCARFDVADGNSLQSLWESCIGVPQTRFLSDFAQTPANRTQTFDALLNLDAYEESWSALKDVPDAFESQQRRLRDDIKTLTGEVQGLPDVRAEVEAQTEQIRTLKHKIARKTRQRSEKQAEYDSLTDTQDEIETLRQKRKTLAGKKEATDRELETARDELETAKQAQQKCEQTQEGYQRHRQASERLERLEEQKTKQEALAEQKNEQKEEILSTEVELQQLEEDLEELNEAQQTLKTRESEKQRYESLDSRIESLTQQEDKRDELQEEIERLHTEIKSTESELNSVQETISKIEAKWEQTTDPEVFAEKINEREAQRKQLASERDRLKGQLTTLRDTSVDAPCPTCDRPLDKAHRSEAIEQRVARIEEVTSTRQTLTSQIEQLSEQREAAKTVKEHVEKLPLYREKAESLESERDEKQAKRDDAHRELEELAQKLEELPSLKAERDGLKDAYEAYQTAEFQVKTNAEVPEKLEKKRAELKREQSALADIQDKLDDFEGLDAKLTEVKETIEATEPAHQTYIQNTQQASQLAERKQAVDQLESERAEIETTLTEVEAELETLVDSFDQERLEALEKEIDELQDEIGLAKGTLSEKQEKLKEARAEVTRLETKLDERQEKLQQLKRLKADQEFATWVRENVREAGPKMREIITGRIGARANELFRSIRGTSAETLEWTSDYEIVVHDADVRKSFTTLSGGEKMAAALAVRLAILEQLASVGIAFLDEPTANLDRQKKRNLVTQLKRLDSFEQLTVISHDQTFESMTDYTLSVTKERQASEVSVN